MPLMFRWKIDKCENDGHPPHNIISCFRICTVLSHELYGCSPLLATLKPIQKNFAIMVFFCTLWNISPLCGKCRKASEAHWMGNWEWKSLRFFHYTFLPSDLRKRVKSGRFFHQKGNTHLFTAILQEPVVSFEEEIYLDAAPTATNILSNASNNIYVLKHVDMYRFRERDLLYIYLYMIYV